MKKKKPFKMPNYAKAAPGQPRGNPEMWRRMVESLLGEEANSSADLTLLILRELPTTLAALKLAYKKAMRKAHPDLGGTDLLASETTAAFQRLSLLVK